MGLSYLNRCDGCSFYFCHTVGRPWEVLLSWITLQNGRIFIRLNGKYRPHNWVGIGCSGKHQLCSYVSCQLVWWFQTELRRTTTYNWVRCTKQLSFVYLLCFTWGFHPQIKKLESPFNRISSTDSKVRGIIKPWKVIHIGLYFKYTWLQYVHSCPVFHLQFSSQCFIFMWI